MVDLTVASFFRRSQSSFCF